MAPKKAAPVVAEPKDVGPGIYVAYSVTTISGIFAAVPNDAEERAKLPACTVTLTTPTHREPCTSTPVAVSESGNHAMRFTTESKLPLEAPMDLLHTLINKPLQIEISVGGVLVGTTHLDMLPLATEGRSTMKRKLQVSLSASPALEGMPLAQSATVIAAVSLAQDAPTDPSQEALQTDDGTTTSSTATTSTPRIPFEFVSPSSAEMSSVIELQIAGVRPTPASLATAVTTAGEMSFVAGCSWQAGSGCAGGRCNGGRFESGAVTWPQCWRTFLSADSFEALRKTIADDSAIYFELARYIASDAFQDPAFSNYHCAALLPLDVQQKLKTPGVDAIECTLALTSSFKDASRVPPPESDTEASPTPCTLTSILPPCNEVTNPKAKAVEAAPPPGPDGSTPCAWQGASASLTVRFSNPPTEVWKPPPKPSKTLRELIPARDISKVEAPTDATSHFKAQCAGMVLSLAKEYQGMFGDQPLDTPEGAAVSAEAEERHRKLVFELNRSGRYLEMKQRLKKSVVAIVKEKFRRSGSMDKDEMMDTYNALYTHLVEQMHGVLNELAADEKPPPDRLPPSTEKLAVLEQLAAECEVCGAVARAEKVHQERLLEDKVPDVWYSFGAFCMRTGDPSKAEECFRQALALDSSYLPALLALACVLWHNGTFTDAMYLEDAEVVAHHTVEVYETNALAWALLAMIYGTRDSKVSDNETTLRNARFKADQLAAQALGASGQPLDRNPFLQLEILLLDLHLGSLAQRAHALSAKTEGAGKLPELPMCEAQALGLLGAPEKAAAILQSCARNVKDGDVKVLVLLGHMHSRAGRSADAIKAYETALRKAVTGCPLDVYIRLGNCYLDAGQLEDAVAVFGQACTARPCANTWLGAGKGYLRLGDLGNADLCFTEANIHDNQNPVVWGYLALTQLLSENDFEADQALRLGYRCGFNDFGLLKEIGGLYVKQGKYSTAIPVLQRAMAAAAPEEPLLELRAMLGDALTEVGDLQAAKAQWETVQMTANPESDICCLAGAAIEALKKQLGGGKSSRDS